MVFMLAPSAREPPASRVLWRVEAKKVAMADEERRRILATLRREREERRAAEMQGVDVPATGTSDEAWERRREERQALVQRLLSERDAPVLCAHPCEEQREHTRERTRNARVQRVHVARPCASAHTSSTRGMQAWQTRVANAR